jgi:alanine racemase
MNLTMIDCTDVPNARAGDTVTMIGGENGECVTADDVAGWSKTISYEILAGLHPLIPRYII